MATITILANIAAIDARDGFVDDEMVYIRGHTTDDDGGQGIFRWDAASTATANNGTIIAGVSGTGRWLRQYSGAINVRWFGATGDGTTDDVTAINNAKTALGTGGALYFPIGNYKISSELDFTSFDTIQIYGDAHGINSQGSKIFGTVAGASLLKMGGGTGHTFKITNMAIDQDSGTGVAAVEATSFSNGLIEHCLLQSGGTYAVFGGASTFKFTIRDCRISAGGISIYLSGHSLVEACNITASTEGIRANGAEVSIISNRLEVCGTALKLGYDAAGSGLTLSRSSISGNSFEGNDTHIDAAGLAECVLQGMSMQGSTNAPSGQSQIGMVITQAVRCKFEALRVFGTYDDVAIRIKSTGSHADSSWESVNAQNGFSMPTTGTWEIEAPDAGPTFKQCSGDDGLVIGGPLYDAGTQSTGTFTPDPVDGLRQKAVNGGAHTVDPPASDCEITVQYTNNASAGAQTTSNFNAVTGDSLTTTDGHDFLFEIKVINGFSKLNIVALQ